jgi:hypothetical protein
MPRPTRMAVKVVDLCSDPYCTNNATQVATPSKAPGLRVLLCDKHAGRFVRLASERGIELEELGLAPLEVLTCP